MPDARRIHAPGRVNLIGDHTDYTGGLVFPMAIDRGTTLTCTPEAGAIVLTSDHAVGRLEIDLPFRGYAADVEPHWGAYVAAMAAELDAHDGFRGNLESDIPAGAGLSSSAALECAVGIALGFDRGPLELARAARRAEHAATGVPTGIMDQLCIASAIEGHATMIDCATDEVTYIAVPTDVDIVVQFVAHRTLEGSQYAARVAECRRAEDVIGPLRLATLGDLGRLDDDTIRRRAHHVISENERVRGFADALSDGDYVRAGRLMLDSHESLRQNFETSTEAMDDAVAALAAVPGVYGVRMTGGGFGGCVVALCAPGTLSTGWTVVPAAGARVL